MDDRESFFMDKPITGPWLDMDISRHENDGVMEEEPLTDWILSMPKNCEIPDNVSIRNSKYYNLPCNCGLVDDIGTYQKLRTHIYFDTYTKNFYRSNINSTSILPDGFPYMECPRHRRYFSDVIRCHLGGRSTVGLSGENIHLKIVLFDATSQNNYALSKPIINYTTSIGDNQPMKFGLLHRSTNTNTTRGSGGGGGDDGVRRKPTSPLGNSKHFHKCDAYHNDKNICNCNEKMDSYHMSYARKNSVVADVLSNYGIDIVPPSKEFYMPNSTLFKNRNEHNTGSRIAQGRWVRRNKRQTDSPNKHNESTVILPGEISKRQQQQSFVDLFSGSPNKSFVLGANSKRKRLKSRSYLGSGGSSLVDADNSYDMLYRRDPNLSRRVITFNESINERNNNSMMSTNKKHVILDTTAKFKVYTRPKRCHTANDEFVCIQNTTVCKDTTPNIDTSRLSSLSHSKCGLPEDDLQRWVTVIGFQAKSIGQIIRIMSSFGPILKIKNSKTCNYLHLMYSKVEFADNAIRKTTIKLDNSIIVSIKPCTNTFIQNEQLHCFDIERPPCGYHANSIVSRYLSWFTSAASKIADYVDGFINEP